MPRYQVSVYRTIGPLVFILADSCNINRRYDQLGNLHSISTIHGVERSDETQTGTSHWSFEISRKILRNQNIL